MGKLPVHDHNMPLVVKVFPGLRQRGQRVRNHRVRKTEQDSVNWGGQMHLCCVFQQQLDVMPLMTLGKLFGFCQHRVATVDAKNFSRRTDAFNEQTKVCACPTTDLKHLVPRLEVQPIYRVSSNVPWKPKQEVEEGVDGRQMIIAPPNEVDIVIEGQPVAPKCMKLPRPVTMHPIHQRDENPCQVP